MVGCDSTLVVDIFNGKTNVLWKLQNDWLICKTKLDLMEFKVSHIYREVNICTDRLTSHAILTRRNSIWNSMYAFINEDYSRNTFSLSSYSCGSLAQARVSPKPKSVSRLRERIKLKRHLSVGKPILLWVSRLSKLYALKRQFLH
ncbi:hypothetical protein Lal_00043107 [Lupinus albus]|nr:hypothetical protein Lal_00043107 [Lupinus albus]